MIISVISVFLINAIILISYQTQSGNEDAHQVTPNHQTPMPPVHSRTHDAKSSVNQLSRRLLKQSQLSDNLGDRLLAQEITGR